MIRHCVILFALLAVWCQADRLELKDGTVLMGEVAQKFKGKVTITNKMYGKVTVSEDDIFSMEIEHPMNVADSENRVMTGTVSMVPEVGEVMVDGYSRVYIQKDITAMWNLGERDLRLPPLRKWGGEVFADVTAKSGNDRKFRNASGIRLNCTGPIDRLALSGTGVYERENGNTSTNKYYGLMDYERQMSGRMSWYVKNEFEHDRMAKLDMRWEASAGGGYHLIMRPDTVLRLRGGIAYQKKRYIGSASKDGEDNIGAEISVHFERKWKGFGSLTCDVTYIPIVDDRHNYNLTHETAFDIPLFVKMPLALRLGIRNECEGHTIDDVENVDTIYFARLVYKW